MPAAAAGPKRVHYHFFATDTFRAANIPILGLRLELLPRSRRREAVELLAEALWGNRRHFRMVLRRHKPFEECQAIALVDDTLGLIGIAVVEAMHSTKPHGDYKILYVHAFVVRANLRKRPGSQEARREELRRQIRCTRFIAALLELAAFHSFHSMIFTATLGERASVPFWIANKAAHFNEKKNVSIVLQSSYNFAAGFKPLGVLEQSPLPFLHRHTLRAKNWTELCARFLRIFRASTIPEIRALREIFPIHHFKAETRIEDVMKSVVEDRVDSRVPHARRRRQATRKRRHQPNRPAATRLARTRPERRSIICGKPPDGGKGEFFACSAYLIEAYSNDGHRGLCSNGAHVSCLNYYMRFNLITSH
ncbi:hypothetical protein CTAYLR_010531 [Chrysophaeum taylorii]|uniref:Uncharacterized protein n=1 Tax=Chrysophaeum taylorii TaxID=2483200 RepID=A0AAD7XP30_9STRA|nr:hypothetical protein CTAYLR_010531 [Chrysophaeum taylorii]